ncbi:MAG: hypothetical protein AABZ10_13380 [Nitrospirota bacterium]
MMNHSVTSKIVFCLSIMFVLFLNAGCARQKSFMMLEDDVLDQDRGFESIAFWRVRVTDRTASISSLPSFSVYHPTTGKGGATDYGNLVLERTKVSGEWSKEDGGPRLESMVFVGSKSGEYLFRDVRFYLYTDQIPNYWKGGTVDRDVFLTVPIHKTCSITQGRLMYLGTIQIEIVREGKNGYSYRVHIVQDTSDFESALKEFQKTYPVLYKRFKNKVDTASWKLRLVEDFNVDNSAWTLPAKDKYLHAHFDNGVYVLESKNNDCHWSFFKSALDKPENFDIELTDRWESGARSGGFGLTFGSDPENFYDFHVSGGAQAKAELYKNSELHSELIGWKDVPADTGPKKNVYRQKIEVRGDALKYYVNDQPAGEVKNELDMKGLFTIGVFVCDKQKAAFDRLTVIER